MKFCQNCNNENPDDSVFCVSCGNKLNQMIKCPFCDKDNIEKAVFCQHCGTKLPESNISTPPSLEKVPTSNETDNIGEAETYNDNSSHDPNLGRMKFVEEQEIYICVICDNCQESVRISKDICIKKINTYSLKPHMVCKCGKVVDEIYDVTNNKTIKTNQENFNNPVPTKLIISLTILFFFVICYVTQCSTPSKKEIEPTLNPTEISKKSTQEYVDKYAQAASTQISEWKQKCKDMTDAQQTYYKPMTSLAGTKVIWGGEVKEVKSSDDASILKSLIDIGALTTEILTGWDMTLEEATTYRVWVKMGVLDYVYLRNVPEQMALKLSEGDNIVFEGMLFESGLSDSYCNLYDVQFLSMK